MLDVELSDFLIHPITLYARQPRVQAIPACEQAPSRRSTEPNGHLFPSKIRDVPNGLTPRLNNARELSPGFYLLFANDQYPDSPSGSALYEHAYDSLPEDRAGNLHR